MTVRRAKVARAARTLSLLLSEKPWHGPGEQQGPVGGGHVAIIGRSYGLR